MTMTIGRPARMATAAAADRGEVAAILTDAFSADPAVRWLYGDGARQRRHFGAFVSAFAGAAFEAGTADIADDGLGAALWLPPGQAPDEHAVTAHIEDTVDRERLPAVFALFEEMGRQHLDGPHWYLPLIGVIAPARRMGIGSMLLREGLRRADRDRLPAYLEATSAANLRLYRRHGFHLTGVIQAADSPPIFGMMRPAIG
jgi:ribosomal protein S18 acetylase RimI-like enzyme